VSLIKDNCTIIIPTHNRHHYLDRLMRWLSTFEVNVIIADSSDDKWTKISKYPNCIDYIHIPGGFNVYYRKISKALKAVATPFVVLCADDDFITEEGLRSSIEFLLKNNEYSFAQGYSYSFQKFNNTIITWPTYYPFHTLENDYWLDRLPKAQNTIYYGVNRTKLLYDIFSFLELQDFNNIENAVAGFGDLAMTLYMSRQGKFKQLNVAFGLREYSPSVSCVGERVKSIIYDDVPHFYRNLLEFMLYGIDEQAHKNSRDILKKIFSADYAGQLNYDLNAAISRKTKVNALPPQLQIITEYYVRIFNSILMYKKVGLKCFFSLYTSNDYRTIKEIILS
jgi:glycosyltransferase domain-containing protein